MIPRRSLILPLMLAACLLRAGPLFAQEEEPRKVVPFEGSHAFRHLLNLHQLEPLASIDKLSEADPEKTVIILFGNPKPLDEISKRIGGLRSFHDRGGAVLIATDREDGGRLKDLGVFINGEIIHVSEQAGYRGHPQCPKITSLAPSLHPLSLNLRQGLATNQPSWIRLEDSPLTTIASIADGRHQPIGVFSHKLPFLVATPRKDLDEGPCIVLAGHSVFMNGMMGQSDNDNFPFADHCIRWLCANGQRKQVLFVEENKVQSNFDVPLAELPLPPPRFISQQLRLMEEENLFNRLLLSIVSRPRILWALTVLASVVLVGWAAWRLARALRHGEPAVPVLEPAAVTGMALPPLVVRRQRAVAAGGIFTEAGRALARQCFETAGFAPPGPPPAPTGNWLQRRRQGKVIQRLWQLAFDPSPPSLDAKAFEALPNELETARKALKRI